MASSASAATGPRVGSHVPKAIALALVLLVAAVFVLKYVFHYYLNFNQAVFTDPGRARPTTG